MNITLGFSPCPNDTYIFAALVNKWIDTGGLDFTVLIEDVEKLNEWAGSSHLDVTKMSFHRALSLDQQYALLNAGAALGNGCGPLLIAKKPLSYDPVIKGPVALPGQWTTAHLLFNLFYPGCTNKQFHLFSDIEEVILNDEVAAGVIIHENRFTYESKGLVRIIDLGEEWEKKTGLPIPLGGIFANVHLPEAVRDNLEGLIRKSIGFAKANPDIVMPYVRMYAKEMSEEVMLAHINLYVNDYSVKLGEKGMKAIDALKKLAT
jgi:1,4-dihydroxy-6-naphthoate synthase